MEPVGLQNTYSGQHLNFYVTAVELHFPLSMEMFKEESLRKDELLG